MKKTYSNLLVHIATLRNTVLATPRGLIAVIENNYQKDGSIKIPQSLQPYMGGLEVMKPKIKSVCSFFNSIF